MISDLLNFPFNSQLILRKRRTIRKELIQSTYSREIKVAVLGGSTTSELVKVLELFLLKQGLLPKFYESEYNKFYEDALFGNKALSAFKPDIIYIHTSHKNISKFPALESSSEDIKFLMEDEVQKFRSIWDSLSSYNCPIIQNNFDFPVNRSLGNLDGYDVHGKTFFINRLNLSFAKEAQERKSLLINDINYLSSSIGLNKWFDKNLWYTAKYAISFEAIPFLANNIANVIVAVLGLTKKCLILDLDNTCWGGVIGDDGLNGIKLGHETAQGQAYLDFQDYVKELKDRGIMLAVCSKNEMENAKEGFTHSDSVLSFSDFTSFYANWEPKHQNIIKIAEDINIGTNSLVFIDDNAMERDIVKTNLSTVSVPNVGDDILDFIDHIEQNGYFSIGSLSTDDLNRNKYYSQNQERAKQQATFESYQDFLTSLKMVAEIDSVSSVYYERVTQLINKTNQFNLTTKRYTITEVESMSESNDFITLYGKLSDKFGDNGLISVVVGKIEDSKCIIDTWLMSCRVLKRDMEFAMLSVLLKECKKRNITEIIGQYRRTAKNNMVADLYDQMGFGLIEKTDDEGAWKLLINDYDGKELPIEIVEAIV